MVVWTVSTILRDRLLNRNRDQADQKELRPMSSRRPQGVPSHRGIHGKLPVGVRSRNGAMAYGGEEDGKWYLGVVESAECFMTRWHGVEAKSSWLRHAAEDVKSDDKGMGGGVEAGAAVLVLLLSTNAEMKW